MAPFSSYFFGKKDKIDTPTPMSDPQTQQLSAALLTAQTKVRAVAAERTVATKYHQDRYNEVVGARLDWLNQQTTRNATTAQHAERTYRTAQDREKAADQVRQYYDEQYQKAQQEEQAALKNLSNWRSFGIAIVDQEKARKAEMQRQLQQRMQELAEAEARCRAAEADAMRQKIARERTERDRMRREERRKREEAKEKQQEESHRAYYSWKSQNAHLPPSQGGANLLNPTPISTQAFATACTAWRTAVETAFQDYAAITTFPEPPVSGTCTKASCKAEKRALKACGCDVQKALRLVRVDLKKERTGWHPDKFSAVREERREEWQACAKEVFQVVSVMYQGQVRAG